MGIQINQYALERLTFGDDDYYDIDYFDGANYQTAKILGSTIKAGIQAGITSDNFYSIDGVLTANRTVDGGLFDLTYNNLGKIEVVSDQLGVNNVVFIVNNNATNKGFDIQDNVTSESVFMVANGEVRINDDYSLPITDGLANQVLTTDGLGQASWADIISGYFKAEVLITSGSISASGSDQAVPLLTYTIPSSRNGDYVIYAVLSVDIAGTDMKPFSLMLFKNGVKEANSVTMDFAKKNENQSVQLTYAMDGLVATDVIAVYCNNDNVAVNTIISGRILAQKFV